MSDTDIDIKITTTADTSGAEQAKKSIFAIEDAAKQAERELDVLEAKRKQSGGLTGVDLTGNAGGHAEKLLDKLCLAKALGSLHPSLPTRHSDSGLDRGRSGW